MDEGWAGWQRSEVEGGFLKETVDCKLNISC